MPKKTKRQKLLAQIHRNTLASANPRESVKTQKPVEFSLVASGEQKELLSYKQMTLKPKSESERTEYTHIRHGIVKILLFTLFSLIFQGVLYFFLQAR